MLIQNQKRTEKSAVFFISLALHAALLALLLLALTEKRLTRDFQAFPQPAPVVAATEEQHQKTPGSAKKEDTIKRKPTLEQPFIVPAPVVYYGNQTMMNNPSPVSGDRDGKSAFEHTPSALPTPPAHGIAPERTPIVQAAELGEKAQAEKTQAAQQKIEGEKNLEQEPVAISELEAQEQAGTFFAVEKPITHKQSQEEVQKIPKKPTDKPIKRAQEERKLTLADIFKNATATIASFAQDGLPTARKAGTEGGDDQGSGHQITIKEGDMKYYTLWAKFLNHLNQSSRFSRRGKEDKIHGWLNNREIQYVLQCGITIDLQGHVLDVDLMHSSGCRGFDEMCLHDIYAAVPYPPVPESLGKKPARFEVSVFPT